jgi:hypothetical protein
VQGVGPDFKPQYHKKKKKKERKKKIAAVAPLRTKRKGKGNFV